jgi:hypothetical protein
MTVNTATLSVTLNADCHYRRVDVIMLIFIMLTVVMLSVVMMNVNNFQ